jgi:hypothetical protein
MGFIIICAIVGSISTFVGARRLRADRSSLITSVILGFFLSVFVGLISSHFLALMVPVKWVEVQSIKLISLRDKSSVVGSFMIGSGNIGLKDYFVYYREWGTGYKKEKVPADYSVIFEDTSSPTLVVKELRFTEEWMELFISMTPSQDVPAYEFHVPKGTIIQKFAVE